MADVAMGVAGAAVGSFFGAAMLGFSIGMTLGGILFPEDLGTQTVGKTNDMRIQGATVGTSIAKVWGVNRVAGNVIWTSSVRESYTKQSHGGGMSGGPTYTTKTYHYDIDIAILVCEGPIDGYRRIWASQDVIYDSRSGSEVWNKTIDPENVRRYSGTETQLPDSLIESVVGSGNCPAYRGFAYVVFEKFSLDAYGSSVPNFTFEVDAGDCNCKIISDWACDKVGLESTEYDFSAVSDLSFRGFVVPSKTDVANILDQLAVIFAYRIVEVDGKIKAVKRGSGSSVATIPEGDMGAVLGYRPTGETVETSRQQEVELPRTYTLNYISESQDFQTFTQQATQNVGKSQQEPSFSVNMVLSDTQARRSVEILLWAEWIKRMSHKTTVSYKYLKLAPSDIVTIPTVSGNKRCEIVEMISAMLGPVELRMIEDDQNIFTQTITGVSGNANASLDSTLYPYMWVYDTNALFDTDADNIGYYVVATSQNIGWPGCVIYTDVKIKTSSGRSTDTPATVDGKCIMGETLTLLASGPTGVWDETNTVDVELYYGSLSTAASDLDVLNGENLIVIGYEILQFRTATLIGTNQYRLSGLIRGRRGTEYAVDSHSIGEAVGLATLEGQRIAASNQEKNKTFGFRALEINRYYSTLPAYTNVQLVGRSRMPYAPCHGYAESDTTDCFFYWVRRVRKDGELVDGYDAPLDESSEAYEVEVYTDETYGTVLNTYTGITAPNWTYAYSNILADFGYQPDYVYIKVYQYSSVIGRGFPLKITAPYQA